MQGVVEEAVQIYIFSMLLKVFLFVLFVSHVCYSGMEEEEGVKYANRCEGRLFIIISYTIQSLLGRICDRM